MNRRLFTALLAGSLALVPISALADTPTDSSGLGPQASQTSGGSSADGSALQPAGANTLQPTSGTDGSTGLSSSNDAAASLQQPATTGNQNLQVILGGDADGPSHSTGHGYSWVWYVVAIATVVVLAGGSIFAVERWSGQQS